MLAPSIFAPRRYPRPGHRVERGVSDDEGEEEWEGGRGAHRGGEGGSLLRGVRVLHRPWLESSGGRVGGKHARGLEGRRRRAAEMRRSLSPRLSLTAPREQPGLAQHTSGDIAPLTHALPHRPWSHLFRPRLVELTRLLHHPLNPRRHRSRPGIRHLVRRHRHTAKRHRQGHPRRGAPPRSPLTGPSVSLSLSLAAMHVPPSQLVRHHS